MNIRLSRPGLSSSRSTSNLPRSKDLKKKKGVVYRLKGVGPGGSDIIAKWSSPERLLKERIIYEEVLPALPVSTVRYYGFIEETDDRCCWLFLESADGEEYSPLVNDHRTLAAQWLSLFHTSAAHIATAARLPDRGPGHYLEQLRSACETIQRNLTNPALTAETRAMLETVVRQLEVVASRWGQVEELCECAPRTLIWRLRSEEHARPNRSGRPLSRPSTGERGMLRPLILRNQGLSPTATGIIGQIQTSPPTARWRGNPGRALISRM